jgi:acyl-CoA reductase-like NAD-dependent aldehyde dehydrogenase
VPAPNRALNFINGEFVPSQDGKYFDHSDPSTGLKSCEVANSDVLDLVKAIQSSNKALTSWLKISVNERAEVLKKCGQIMTARATELAAIQALDTGCPVTSALQLSLPAAAARFTESAEFILRSSASNIINHPVGIAAVVTGWSDPFNALAERASSALSMGNAVIAKTSEYAPRVGAAFAEVLNEAGLPAGVFNLLQGRGVKIGQAIAQHPGLHFISFQGSTEVGKIFLAEATETLKSVHLAMGAKNPVVIFPGIDLAATAKLVAKISGGCHPAQCLRGSRVFIQESIFKEFLGLLQSELSELKVGPALDPKTEIGPLIHHEALRKFESAVAQARGEKGNLKSPDASEDRSSLPPGGFFAAPALISDLTYCSTLQQTEVLGPLITATSFKYQLDALKYANTNPYGHTAYVFESDLDKARKFCRKIETGQVFVNPIDVTNPSHSRGLKYSGLGHSTERLRDFFSLISETNM